MLSSTTACALDMDCGEGTFCFQGWCASECDAAGGCGAGAGCSERGQCLLSGKADQHQLPGSAASGPAATPAATPAVLTDLALLTAPPWRQPVQAGQETVTIAITLTGDVPAADIACRVERTDDLDTAGDVKHATGDGPTFEVTLTTGQANPSDPDSESVDVFIVTSAGTVGIGLVPESPLSGSYAGVAMIPLFGPYGLPLDV